MAEADVEMPSRYFCHKCSQDITPVMPDFICPRCRLGFIEEVSNEQIDSHSNDDVLLSDDSDEQSSVESNHIMDVFEHLPQIPLNSPESARRVNEFTFNSRPNDRSNDSLITSTPIEESSDEPGTSSTSTGRARGRRRRRLPRFVQFNFPQDSMDSQQTIEGIFSHILSSATFGQLNQTGNASRDRAGNAGRRGEFLNFDYQFPLLQVLHGNPGDYAWGSGGLDAVISQLLNQLDGTGPPPMPKDEIDRLPVVKITQDQVDKNLQCTVCMEDYKLAEDVKKLPCTHVYHHECIVPWLEMHGTCPICRKLLNASQANQHNNDRVSSQSNQGVNSSNTASSPAYYEFPDCD